MNAYLLGILAVAIFVCWLVVAIKILQIRAYLTLLTLSSILIYLLITSVVYVANIDLLFWSFTAIYWFLVMTYFFVFFGFLKSISVRTLLNLLRVRDNTLDYKFIYEEYVVKDSYTKRIEILLKRDTVFMEQGKLLLTKKGKRFISLYAKVQKIFMIEQSG
tara:strand:- start:611 stop:1093 length:483 start_codon:yes stop_codon:yes gene_type:complete